MRIAFASGKGGTGKTLISTHFARKMAQRIDDVVYIDADVEEPNGHVFLVPEITEVVPFEVDVPERIRNECEGCDVCQQVCAYDAIVVGPDRFTVFHELCHGCGACLIACPKHVLRDNPRRIGELRRGRSHGLSFACGVLDMGEARATPLIRGAVAEARRHRHAVIDGPPGTSCGAVAAVSGADLMLLVTEPTAFGLHDLQAAVAMCRKLGLSPRVVINRADLGEAPVRDWCWDNDIEVVAEVPFSRTIATDCAAGRFSDAGAPELQSALDAIEALVEQAAIRTEAS